MSLSLMRLISARLIIILSILLAVKYNGRPTSKIPGLVTHKTKPMQENIE